MNKVIKVYPREFKTTNASDEVLLTENLEGCVGLGLYRKEDSMRGLGHVYHSGIQERIALEATELDSFLETILKTFGEIDRVFVGYIPYFFIKGEGYVNPLGGLLVNKLSWKGYLPEVHCPKKISSGDAYFMSMALKPAQMTFIPTNRLKTFTSEDVLKLDLN